MLFMCTFNGRTQAEYSSCFLNLPLHNPCPLPEAFPLLAASQSTGHSLSLLGVGVPHKRSNKPAIIQQWVSPPAFIIQMHGLSGSCSGRLLIHTDRVREIIASVRWTLKRGRPLFSSDPASQDRSLIPDPR